MSTTTGADTGRDALAAAIAARRGVTGRVNSNDLDFAASLLAAGWRPPAPVITGHVPAVTAALDALPVGSIITCDDDEPLVYVKRASGMGFDVWREDGRPQPVDSGHIARHQVPVTVVREGMGA